MWKICTFNPLWGTGAGEQNANEETHEGGGHEHYGGPNLIIDSPPPKKVVK